MLLHLLQELVLQISVVQNEIKYQDCLCYTVYISVYNKIVKFHVE